MNFETLGLSSSILKAVDELGFETPTPIQEKVIPYILNGARDIVGLAQTGTGKTAAFGLPILEKTEIKANNVQSLILCPTRELCLQITHDMENYSRYMPNISITPVYGGAGMDQQIRAMRKGTHVIVATPGRLLDLIRRKAADISKIQYLVLDEADIMVNMGFKEDLDAILETAPKTRQTLLFSATMPQEVAKIAASYMKDPLEVSVGQKNSGTSSVEHKYFMVHARDKYLALKRIIDFHPEIYGIVFCRTRISTQEIADSMIKDGYNAEALHGDLSQAQREGIMRKFRERNLQLLIATDIAARGLDVTDLTHVIHYDLPDELEIYTHRSGRTGRAGKTGISLSIINMKEKHKIGRIEKTVQRKITAATVPLGKEICEKQLIHLAEQIKAIKVDSEQIALYMAVAREKLADLSRDELLERFLSRDFSRIFTYYQKANDLAAVSSVTRERETTFDRKDRSSRTSTRSDFTPRDKEKRQSYDEKDRGFTYLVVNLGKQDQILPPQLIGLVNRSTHNRNIRLGNIDIASSKSRFQVENRYCEEVYGALNGFKFNGKKLVVEREQKEKKDRSARK